MDNLKLFIRDVEGFPIEGVTFRDITPLLEDGIAFQSAVDGLVMLVEENFSCHTIAGIEARGFIFASAIASLDGKGFVPIRKAGKLPPPTIKIDASKEYGHDILEVKEGKGDIVIVDDVLATGGTLLAAEELLRLAGYNVLGAATLIDLTYLHGDIRVGGKNVVSLIKY
jgi:adenine phosphoribosyltransferase